MSNASRFDLDKLIGGFEAADRSTVQQALEWVAPKLVDHLTGGGETLLAHAFETAKILAGLQADVATRVAALLMLTPEVAGIGSAKTPTPDPIDEQFGTEIGQLVQGTRALSRLGSLASGATDGALNSLDQKEMLRKMLLAMAVDLRIVLIRLASRLQTLRWLAAEKRPCDPILARDTLDL